MTNDRVVGPWGEIPPENPATPRQSSTAPQAVPTSSADAVNLGDGRMEKLVFSGERREFSAITWRGMALYLPTFGFYRFWLKTDQRRFYWGHTSLEGSSFEYRGTPRELLTGFLIAIAVYMPISVVYFLLGLYAETLQDFASAPFFLFTVLFGYFAAYRARRYRLTRTVYRGVRFWMEGSAWKFAGIAFLWLLLTIITLGVAFPWMVAALERRKMRNSFYGDLRGEFTGTGWELCKALIMPGLGLVIGAVIPLLNLIAIPVMLSVITVRTSRWFANGARFGAVSGLSDIESFALAGPIVKAALITVLFWIIWGAIGTGFGFALSRSLLGSSQSIESLFSSFPAIMAIGVWTMVGLLATGCIKAIFYDYEKTVRILKSLTFTNLGALDAVEAKGDLASSFGEGLADALGSDGF